MDTTSCSSLQSGLYDQRCAGRVDQHFEPQPQPSVPATSPRQSTEPERSFRLSIPPQRSNSRTTSFLPDAFTAGAVDPELSATSNTTAGGNVYNYSSQVPSSYPRSEYIMRGDWQINQNHRMSVRWGLITTTTSSLPTAPPRHPGTGLDHHRSQEWSGQRTNDLRTPRLDLAWVNESSRRRTVAEV